MSSFIMKIDSGTLWWIFRGFGTTTPVTDESYTDNSNIAYTAASDIQIYVKQD